MTDEKPPLDFDQPLRPGKALAGDLLSRRPFAMSAAHALRNVSASASYVLSVEGAWGSGKTSTLAMIEELLQERPNPPVMVHFNPWLVGDRDALLRQFLAQLAKAVEVSDHAKEGRRVSKEIKAYSKVFDVVKLIPGAEPWATLVKSVFETVGEAAGSVAEYRTPDIERQKLRVEAELRKFPRPVVVIIDDIDRLFPAEVFEMIRIIKTIGELPNVGYVVAWDPGYISQALQNFDVPSASAYLDKIVQIRMPLPALALSARARLINAAFDQFAPEATDSHFPGDDKLMSFLYFSGLRELLEQPRDVSRVFNTAKLIEPALRGEVALADVIGLAALMVKASPVFELLRRNPRYFVGRLSSDQGLLDKSDDLVKDGATERQKAFENCGWPAQARRVVHYLFPRVAEADDTFSVGSPSEVHGRLAHPARLLVALQLAVGSGDVSRRAAGRYLRQPAERPAIAGSLSAENCLEFMELLGDVAEVSGGNISDLDALCLDVARLVDKEPFLTRVKSRDGLFTPNPEDGALNAIGSMVKAVDAQAGGLVAATIVLAEEALTVAAELVARSYVVTPDTANRIVLDRNSEPTLLKAFSTNVLKIARSGSLLQLSSPGFLLRTFARAVPEVGPQVFSALKAHDPSLDGFALQILRHSIDSTNGQTYRLPDKPELIEAFCPLHEFKEHAVLRLADDSLANPARAAWRSVVEGKALYGIDGSDAR